MKLSELSLSDLLALSKLIKREMKLYNNLEEYERLTSESYLELDSKLIEIEKAIEAFKENIIY
ncbi:hypothetical protein [Flavobacterium sp. YO64]|uniref:hypothetical protein n=1 Tax=Flavobacterium sp. YO64 TaxID=394559 RepID=UPI00100AC843|nr:hypothetical protein [Flavobacterium sp. YO64]RXM44237.1 hypothetical protein BOW57_10160 [Flavobacterium sp. YO64]